MADAQTKIVLTASDQTKAAFQSASNNLKNLGRSAETLRGTLAGIAGGLGVGVFAAFAKNTLDMADAMNDLSDRTGVAVKDLASLRRIAEESDTSLEGLAKGLQKITLSVSEAERGNQTYANALKALGVSAKDPLQALYQIADAVKATNDPTRTAADLQKVLGKNYTDLLPLLKQGSEELKRSAKESESFADAIARLAPEASKLNDELGKLKEEAAGGAAVLLHDMVPVLKTLLVSTLGVGEAFYQVGSSIGATAAAAASAARGEFKEAAQIMTLLFDDLEKRQADFGKRFNQIFAEAQGGGSGKGGAGFGGITFPSLAGRSRTAGSTKAGGSSFNPLFDVGGGILYDLEAYQDYQQVLSEARTAQENFNNDIKETQRALLDLVEPSAAIIRELEKLDQLEGIVDPEILAARRFQLNEQLDKLNEVNDTLKAGKSFAEEFGLVFESAMQGAIRSGGDFQDVLKGLAADVIQLVAQTLILEPILKSIKETMSGTTSMSTSSSGSGLDLGSLFSEGFGNGQNLLGDFASLFGFKDGGIMTANGPLQLRQYAMGGIASSPQVALFGEGSMNEAYVPLPDGRRIPVEMRGGGGKVINQTVNITAANPTEVRLSRGAMAADVGRAMNRFQRWM